MHVNEVIIFWKFFVDFKQICQFVAVYEYPKIFNAPLLHSLPFYVVKFLEMLQCKYMFQCTVQCTQVGYSLILLFSSPSYCGTKAWKHSYWN